jgi:hypothetical protein
VLSFAALFILFDVEIPLGGRDGWLALGRNLWWALERDAIIFDDERSGLVDFLYTCISLNLTFLTFFLARRRHAY